MLNNYERKVYSQNGEDGIIEEIFKRISSYAPTTKTFIEFGIEDGLQCNCRRLVEEDGWSGLFIEGSPENAAKAKEHYSEYPVKVSNKFITRENIIMLLDEGGAKADPDLLSVDIDGNDYWVLHRILEEFVPKVIVVEYNANYTSTEKWVMTYNPNHVWDGTDYQGASLTSLSILCSNFDYSLVATDSNGVNAFFVRNVYMDGFKSLTPEEAYHPPKYIGHMNNGNYGHPHRDGEHLKI